MRLGIDGRYIQDHFPGIGRYTYNLVEGLSAVSVDDTVVVVHNPRLPNTRYDMAALGALPRVELVATDARPFSPAEQWRLPVLARRLGLDIWHAPYYIGPYRLPCPLVVTVHDAISSRYPQYLPSLAARVSYELAMRLALRAARQVIAVSQTSRDDLMRFFGVPARRLSVVHEAADARYAPQLAHVVAALRARLSLPDRYALYLGMNKPHKNVTRLVIAWAAIAAEARPLTLIIAGRSDPRYAEARQAADRLGMAQAIHFLGDVSEADLPALYSGAELFVFPSLYEGFGLPVLEAMACGAPVVCSTTPALLEVAGDAALTVDPQDTHALSHALASVMADAGRRSDLSRRSLQQATHFSWLRAARETLQVYKAAV